jgi:hypothetical protein
MKGFLEIELQEVQAEEASYSHTYLLLKLRGICANAFRWRLDGTGIGIFHP